VNDLWVHLLLFAILSAVIVLMSAFFSEPEDGPALRSFPRRLVVFFVGCGILTGVLLLFEHTLASVN
jgi:hypothetical protein